VRRSVPPGVHGVQCLVAARLSITDAVDLAVTALEDDTPIIRVGPRDHEFRGVIIDARRVAEYEANAEGIRHIRRIMTSAKTAESHRLAIFGLGRSQ
jgi:hypothetical protein